MQSNTQNILGRLMTQIGWPQKRRSAYLLALLSTLTLAGCETVIDAKLDQGPTQLSVDAWLTDALGEQRIRLTQTAPYLQNGAATPATGARVGIRDGKGRTYLFTDPDNDGFYSWRPTSPTDTLGRIGETYTLGIEYGGQQYVSVSRMNRVPAVDSIVFREEKVNPISEERGFQAEFYVKDFPGAPDYYRIRFFRNGQLQNRPNDLITVYDAGFSSNGNTDGLLFIRPIRQSINPERLYARNDTVRVEIQSITPEAFFFLAELRTQISNGGLFATPPANVPTNIRNVNTNGPAATGFFVTSAVRSRTARVTDEMIRK
ncbi:DUF4249 family protein [Rudanella paleaurantiibacter]|uniref:DUF4249 family protein n=1 Tax=Rudanella paleaurantiibacter TaxID=2614655 RepID=A0A7J5TZ87_9BACT|nr:DUF4249 domain-containing protein [Rudanella paleaurantiibacter]KAB7730452.1 DUF4249 family protein [Rudanella paleaurantiibacter]